MLSNEEIKRYARHIVLKEVGGNGQNALKKARVLIIGIGGLGAPAALYLAAAGIGKIGLVDYDKISLDNLQRQILYQTDQIGLIKTETAKKKLSKINPHVKIESINEKITEQTAEKLIQPYQYILDASDNFGTRHLINQTCYTLGKILISGAAAQWIGHIGIFKAGLTKQEPVSKRLPCYQCFTPINVKETLDCQTFGVIGALTGIIGSFMALETLKEIAQTSPSNAGKLFYIDTNYTSFKTLILKIDPNCPVCGSDS